MLLRDPGSLVQNLAPYHRIGDSPCGYTAVQGWRNPRVSTEPGSPDERLPSPDMGELWAAGAAQARRALVAIDADVRARMAARAVWTQVADAFADGRIETLVRLIADPRLVASTEPYPQAAATIQNLRIAVQRALASRSEDVLRAVQDFGRAQGWRTSASAGRVTIDGLVVVELGGEGTVKVQARQVRSLDSDEVIRGLAAEYERVWARARSAVDSFAVEFESLVVEARRDADAQGYIRLLDLYRRMKALRPKTPGRLVSYYRDEFAADISCLAQHAGHRRRFAFSAARDPSIAFPVVLDDGTLNQYGYVRLRVEAPSGHPG